MGMAPAPDDEDCNPSIDSSCSMALLALSGPPNDACAPLVLPKPLKSWFPPPLPPPPPPPSADGRLTDGGLLRALVPLAFLPLEGLEEEAAPEADDFRVAVSLPRGDTPTASFTPPPFRAAVGATRSARVRWFCRYSRTPSERNGTSGLWSREAACTSAARKSSKVSSWPSRAVVVVVGERAEEERCGGEGAAAAAGAFE